MTVVGGYRSRITLDCNGQDSCRDIEVDASDASELTISGCDASLSCIGTTLFCPENVMGVPKCIVNGMVLMSELRSL